MLRKLFAIIGGFGLLAMQQAAPTVQELLRQADAYYQEKSFAKARELYLKIPLKGLPDDQAQWVDFRRADTLWRSGAGVGAQDSGQQRQARQLLEEIVQAQQRLSDPPPSLWAEAQLSLGDLIAGREPYYSTWGEAWDHYQKALDWWAGSQDIEAARKRYLETAIRIFSEQGSSPADFSFNPYIQQSPAAAAVLEKALSIALEPADQAALSYLLAKTLILSGYPFDSQRAVTLFEQAIEEAQGLDWGEKALLDFAQWLEHSGPVEYDEQGNPRRQPDPARALQLYRRLADARGAEKSAYYRQAQERIDDITGSMLAISVNGAFFPGSEVGFDLRWRNLSDLKLDLFAIDLTRNISPPGEGRRGDWNEWLSADGLSPQHSWQHQLKEVKRYHLGQQSVRLPYRLDPGAYLLKGRSGAVESQAVLLISQAALVLMTSGPDVTAYYCDAWDGSPLSGARLSLWEQRWKNGDQEWVRHETVTDDQGLARFEPQRRAYGLHAFARKGNQQAYVHTYVGSDSAAQWTFHTITDRPAYRPGEVASWKAVARLNSDDGYLTPSGRQIVMRIQDPQGREVSRRELTLNEFGSAWGSLELTSKMPLGMYSALFYEPGIDRPVANSQLFRLEEYKLPEFRVEVTAPLQEGQPKVFRPGERLEAIVSAEYYFGGPVAGAQAELIVRRKLFQPSWNPPRPYSWLYRSSSSWGSFQNYGYTGEEIHRQTLITDAAGQVKFSYQPPVTSEDLEYTIEARLRDSSRREVAASTSLIASQQRLFLFPRIVKAVLRPGDLAQVELWAKDAKQQPVQAEGTLRVSRQRMYEVWYDPQGRPYEGRDLRRVPQGPDSQGWVRQWKVEREEILSKPFRCTAEGRAEFSFRPEKEGSYIFSWFSPDPGSKPAQAEGQIWVASNATTDLGVRSGGVQIVLESDTVLPGRTAHVLFSLAEPDGYVLFSRQSGRAEPDVELIHVKGTAKLLELEIGDLDVPNLFLKAALVSRGGFHLDSQVIAVPAKEKFLRLEVASDRSEYQPRQKGTIRLRVTDQAGNPVRAELALSVADESVFDIQESLSADPRSVFYGPVSSVPVQLTSSFQTQPYRLLVKNEADELLELRYSFARPLNGRGILSMEAGRQLAEVAGGTIGGIPGGLYDIVTRSGARHDQTLSFSARKVALPMAHPVAAEPAAPQLVRSDFRSTLLWEPALVSDQQGQISVPVEFADKLTTWRASVQAWTTDSRFGTADTSMRTSQPLIVRLQAPRFFVQGDEVTVSAVIHNYSDRPETVRPRLEWASGHFEELSSPPSDLQIEADGQGRADWRLRVLQPGQTVLHAEARGARKADAVEQTHTVYEHGLERLIARSGRVDADGASVELQLPAQRRPGSTRLQINLTPSLAAVMLDALPYLIDYPYGCTEQTMSRFMPAVAVAKTLRDQGVPAQVLEKRLFGGQGASSGTNQGTGMAQLDDVIERGLQRLDDFQHDDGGWGWWKEGSADLYMSSYVLWGLSLARQAGIEVDWDVWNKAVNFLEERLAEAGQDPDLQAWMLQALTAGRLAVGDSSIDDIHRRALDNLWQHRQDLSAAGRALLAVSAHRLGETGRVGTLLRNLENGVRSDDPSSSSLLRQSQAAVQSSRTVHWGSTQSSRHWWEGAVGSTALHLQALLEIDPAHPLIEPAVQWMVQNRRGNQWSNTRDTALAVLSLNDYLKATGELEAESGFEVLVNGHQVASGVLKSLEEALARPVRIEVDPLLLGDGTNQIEIRRRSAQGSLYYAAEARFYSLEEPIPAGGNQIFVQRQYVRLVPVETLLKGTHFERRPLQPGQALQSGERVEVILTVEAKNDLSYLMLEDLKPAGLESIAIQSGSGPPARQLSRQEYEERQTSAQLKPPSDDFGVSRHVYRELRDRKVALFIDRLEQGLWEIRYQLRAEVPGAFHALPLVAEAMYAPEIRSNSQEQHLEVVDR